MGHGGRSYLGFRGTRLNIAIGVIAGLDFLYVSVAILCDAHANNAIVFSVMTSMDNVFHVERI
jgi:hypothetical protein